MSTVENHEWDGVNEPTVFIDFLGQEIRVGDYIVYATSQSSSANCTVGQVLAFRTVDASGEPLGHKSYDYDTPWIKGSGPRPSFFKHQWKFYVQPIYDSRWRGNRKEFDGSLGRKVTIATLHNVHKVNISLATFEVPDAD